MTGSSDNENYILTYILIEMISNYFQTNTSNKCDKHVKANVKKRPSLYGFGNIKQLEL